MKQIIYFDSIFPYGHKKMNSRVIEILSKSYKVHVLANKGWFDINNDVCVIHDEGWKTEWKNKLEYAYRMLINMIKAAKICKELQADKIIMSSYDIIGFFVTRFLLPLQKGKVILVEHNNIDSTRGKIKRLIYLTYANKYKHVVLSEFIKTHMVELLNVDKEMIYVAAHPIYGVNNPNRVIKYDCCAISNSNDSEFIKKMINAEMKEKVFSKNDIKMVIRTTAEQPNADNIVWVSQKISDQKYNEYINSSRYIFLATPEEFQYRINGTLIDALGRGLQAICTKSLFALETSKQYHTLCKLIGSLDELIEILGNPNSDVCISEYNDFLEDHSDARVAKDYEIAIESN